VTSGVVQLSPSHTLARTSISRPTLAIVQSLLVTELSTRAGHTRDTNMATAVNDVEQVSSPTGLIPCSSPRPRPPASAYDEILTLSVGKPGGDAPKVFRVYRGVLYHYSEYFKTMLNSGFRESGSSALDFEDTTPETFQVFYDFINTGNLAAFAQATANKSVNKIFHRILAAYVFADYHLAKHSRTPFSTSTSLPSSTAGY
jgi:hypothetical protein